MSPLFARGLGLLLVLAPLAASAGPLAQIVAPTSGRDSLEVNFSCLCTPSSASVPIVTYQWDFGLGWTTNEEEPTYTFYPGSYDVHLTVVDAEGGSVTVYQQIVVSDGDTLPPSCDATVSASSLFAPADVTWTGTSLTPALDVEQTYWIVDGPNLQDNPTLLRTALPAGWHSATYVVVDKLGLKCRSTATIAVLSQTGQPPPRIVSAPNDRASCAQPYSYSNSEAALALGTGTPSWSATTAPEGFVIHPTTGAIQWTPSPEDRGQHGVVLQLQTEHGTAHQDFDIHVDCQDELEFGTPFGCGVAPHEGPWRGWPLVFLALFLVRGAVRKP